MNEASCCVVKQQQQQQPEKLSTFTPRLRAVWQEEEEAAAGGVKSCRLQFVLWRSIRAAAAEETCLSTDCSRTRSSVLHRPLLLFPSLWRSLLIHRGSFRGVRMIWLMSNPRTLLPSHNLRETPTSLRMRQKLWQTNKSFSHSHRSLRVKDMKDTRSVYIF